MRILYCHNFYQQPGGEDRVFYDECAMLEEYGHEVKKWTLHNDSLHELGKFAAAKKTFWNSESYQKISEILKEFRPEVVHFGNTFPLISPAAYWACKRHGAAVVQTLHNFRLVCPGAGLFRQGEPCHKCIGKSFAYPGVMSGCYRNNKLATAATAAMVSWHRIYGTWHKAIDAFITLTDFSKKIYVEGGLPEQKLKTKPNFVADPENAYRAEAERSGVVFVGRLVREKGVDVALSAWKALSEDIRLTIVGDGPEGVDVQKAAELDPRIRWIPKLEHQDVLMEMRKAKVCIIPSRFYETFGLTTVEAGAVGTPTVGSNIGATQEIIEHQRTGLLFPSGDWQALKDSVLRITEDSDFAVQLGKNAREKFLQNFTKESNYRRLMEIYQSVV